MLVRSFLILTAPTVFGVSGVALARSVPSSSQPTSFTLDLTFQPNVGKYAARTGARPHLIVLYQGVPKKQFQREVPDDDPWLFLGHESRPLPLSGGTLMLGKGLDRKQFHKLAKPVEVAIFIVMGSEFRWSDAKYSHAKTNGLACTGGLGNYKKRYLKFADLARRPKRVSCAIPRTGFATPRR